MFLPLTDCVPAVGHAKGAIKEQRANKDIKK